MKTAQREAMFDHGIFEKLLQVSRVSES
jgi:phosphatidylinositol glycan class S